MGRAATPERVTEGYHDDLARHLDETKSLDRALAMLAGVVIGWTMTRRLDVEGLGARIGVVGLCLFVVGPLSFSWLRQRRNCRFWTDGSR